MFALFVHQLSAALRVPDAVPDKAVKCLQAITENMTKVPATRVDDDDDDVVVAAVVVVVVVIQYCGSRSFVRDFEQGRRGLLRGSGGMVATYYLYVV